MAVFDFQGYQQQTSDLIARASQKSETFEPIMKQLRQLADEAEGHLDDHPGDRLQIDCGPGCSSCCVVNVSTLLPEGLSIAHYLRSGGEKQKQQVEDRLNRLWNEIRGLDDEDRLFVRRSCAFLDENGCCGIYPVRPLLCRSVTSTDAKACCDALSGLLLGDETSVLMHQFQQSLYESLFKGVTDGLEEAGIDSRSYQLAGLIRFLLRNPDVEKELLQGRQLTWQDLY